MPSRWTCFLHTLVTSLFGVVLGCGGAPPPSTEALPSWVLTPPVGLCGVGSAPRSSSTAIDRTVATARGRADLASQVELQVQSLLSSFEEEGGAGPATKRVSAQQVSQRLIGARPRQEHLGSGELFVLVCIGGEQVTEALTRVVETHEVNDRTKLRLRARSEATFQELDAQLEAAFGATSD